MSSCELEDEAPARFHVLQVAHVGGPPADPDPLVAGVRAILAAEPRFTVTADALKKPR